MIKVLLLIFLAYNLYCFLLMCYDKWQATRGGWRISESVLLMHGVFFGALGILAGIYSPLKHKRNNMKFAIGVPLILIIEIVLVLYSLSYLIGIISAVFH